MDLERLDAAIEDLVEARKLLADELEDVRDLLQRWIDWSESGGHREVLADLSFESYLVLKD